MDQFIIDIIAAGGYLGIVFLMALENIVPPVPSEIIMGIGGLLVARGEMEFWPLLLAGTIGSTAGNYVWFWAGNSWGYERLEPFIDRWGRWLTMDWQHIVSASVFFRKYGQWVVLVLRFSPILRTMISLPAGLAHMKTRTFLAYTFIGTAIWNVLLIKGGELLGHFLADSQHIITWIILGSVGIGAVIYIYRVITFKPRAKSDD